MITHITTITHVLLNFWSQLIKSIWLFYICCISNSK